MKKHRCRPCVSGVLPDQPLTFDPECKGCQEKLAAGKRTGLESLPIKNGSREKRLSEAEFKKVISRRFKAKRKGVIDVPIL